MKKVVIPVLVVIALTVLINAVVPQTQSSNPNIGAVREDSVLTAYAISPKDEAQFSVNNKSVAKFWDKLKEAGVRSIWLRGYREINPNESNRYEDEFDCQAIINAAYGQKGLYLLCKVLDNSFPGPLLPDSWANDVIDFFIDPNPSNDMYAKPDQYFIMQPFQWTKTMAQFQYNFSKTGISDSIHFNIFDPSFSRETFVQTGNVFEAHLNFFKVFTHKQAKDSLGLAVNVVRLNDVTRIQEWFIPWKLLSARNKMPSVGSRFALTIEYSDVDVVDSGNIPMATPNVSKRISWGGRGDPYNGALGSERIWGDIEFGDSIITSLALTNCTVIPQDSLFKMTGWMTLPLSADMPVGLIPPKNPKGYAYGTINTNPKQTYFAVSKFKSWGTPQSIDSNWQSSIDTARNPFDSMQFYLIMDDNHDNNLSNDKSRRFSHQSDMVFAGEKMKWPRKTLIDSFNSNGQTIQYYLQIDNARDPYIGYRRNDVLTGTINFEGKMYKTAIYAQDLVDYSNMNSVIAIDVNNDGRINVKPGSNEYFLRFNSPLMIGTNRIPIASISPDGKTIAIKKIEKNVPAWVDASAGALSPDFTAVDSKGKSLTLSKFYKDNNFTILYFFTAGCPGCENINNAPKSSLDALQHIMDTKLGKTKILGIKLDGTTGTMPTKFPVVIDNPQVAVGELFHNRGIPCVVVIDKKGKIIFHDFIGCLNMDIYSIWQALGRKDDKDAMQIGTKWLVDSQKQQSQVNELQRDSASVNGLRAKSDVMRIVLKNLSGILSNYNLQLKTTPNLAGKITIKFAIDESGQVISVVVLNATTNNTDFEKQIATAIKFWQFGKIDKPGDITEVVYPFMFQQ